MGRAVATLKPGDRVIPRQPGLGTWRSALVCSAAELTRVPSDIAVDAAAT